MRSALFVCLVLSACSPTTATCPMPCEGCCTAQGTCVRGDEFTACGVGGGQCVACEPGVVCLSGRCLTSSADAGSGGTGGAGGAAGAGGTAGGGGTPEMSAWVTAHNQARAQAMPVPSPALAQVAWSTTAENQAKSWAMGCRFVHSMVNGFGENLYAATASGGAPTPQEIVSSWVSEVSDYNYQTNTCAAGKQCGHYTQVVWRASVQIGCAIQRCTANSPFGMTFPTWYLGVCNYQPQGNIVGQKPY